MTTNLCDTLFTVTVTFAGTDGQLHTTTVCDTFVFSEVRAIMTAKHALAQWHKAEDLAFVNATYRCERPRMTEPYGV